MHEIHISSVAMFIILKEKKNLDYAADFADKTTWYKVFYNLQQRRKKAQSLHHYHKAFFPSS